MVVLNRIYTRTGDDGTTALGSGERRPKYDLRVSAYGTVDETNAVIGVARLHLADARELDAMLGLIQNDLVDLAAKPEEPVGDAAIQYMNRLSDFLFVASRSANDNGAGDVLWVPGQNR